jgi:hypothetical protein
MDAVAIAAVQGARWGSAVRAVVAREQNAGAVPDCGDFDGARTLNLLASRALTRGAK